MTATQIAQNQIFISHSGKDQDVKNEIANVFADTGTKQVFMEYERYSRDGKPNWKWIRDEIRKSKAVFVILTRNINSTPQTRNWVSFEIGVAATCDPPIPVYVFREEDVNFPVPYLSVYFPLRVFKPPHTTRISASKPANASIIAFRKALQRLVKILILSDLSELSSAALAECEECKNSFSYFGNMPDFPCPCCTNKIKPKYPF
jgi:hypothetical protein